jgi:hypothetical protein
VDPTYKINILKLSQNVEGRTRVEKAFGEAKYDFEPLRGKTE